MAVSDKIQIKRLGQTLDLELPLIADGSLRWGRHGELVVRAAEYRLLIERGIPGEKVRIRTRARKNNDIWATVEDVLEPSPSRVDPLCSMYPYCSTCQWQHIDYKEQLQLKTHRLSSLLGMAGMAVEMQPIQESPAVYGHRALLKLSTLDSKVGFISRNGGFVAVSHCPVACQQVNAVLGRIQGHAFKAHNGIQLRGSDITKDFAIFPRLERLPEYTNKPDMREDVAGIKLKISAASLVAQSAQQMDQMWQLVRPWIDLKKDELLVDCFAGIGFFSVAAASSGHRVAVVEDNKTPYEDARDNLKAFPHVELYRVQIEEILPALQMDDTIGICIVNSPRTGLKDPSLQALIRAKPRRIIYIGSDALGAATDLPAIIDGGYRCRELMPVDQAPHTYQVGVLAILEP